MARVRVLKAPLFVQRIECEAKESAKKGRDREGDDEEAQFSILPALVSFWEEQP